MSMLAENIEDISQAPTLAFDETQQQVVALYRAWPSRKAFDPKQGSATAFYGWLQASGDPVWLQGNYGVGSKFQAIASWIAEWEGVAGEIERMQANKTSTTATN